MTAEPASFDLDRFLPYLVSVLADRLSRDLAATYEARFGLSIPEWRVIAHLFGHADVSVREVHARVAMDKPKVSRAAARLQAAGLIRKHVPDGDRRLVALALTEQGRALFAAVAPLALDFEERALEALSPEEAGEFRRLIGKLLAPRERGAVVTRPAAA